MEAKPSTFMEMQNNLMIIIITLILVSLFTCGIFSRLFSSSKPSTTTTITTKKLPPGPSGFHLIANFIWHRKPFFELVYIISTLRHKYGPIMTVNIGSQRTIYIADNTLAHQSLIQHGAIFADRPENNFIKTILSKKPAGISLAPYGSAWRILRRNLSGTTGVLHPSRLKSSYSHIRKRVLDNLIGKLKQESEQGQGTVYVAEHFKHTIFSLMFLICFGDNVDENLIRELEEAENRFFMFFPRLVMLSVVRKLGRIMFRNRWNELQDILKSIDDIVLSLIRARKKAKQENQGNNIDSSSLAYIDTLFELQVPNGDLEESDVLSLSNEFVVAGTYTTNTALQWIMANMVKYPKIQAKVFAEMNQVVNHEQEWIKEDDLQKMPYLQAVILEGLRRHPPVSLTSSSHLVTEDVELGGYLIPKGISVNYLIPDLGRNPNLWEDPMEFKPERFLFHGENGNERKLSFDITGSKEIKMLPFGAGRRMCPGIGLAILNLEYFVANLIWYFEWSSVDEKNVIDLSEQTRLTTEMKTPLYARISPRINK
ncbi:hypothetical protein Q3G72_008799 [Acer saccharum]|nr:hypothetical protein Q3G72_008799 [Acer saccharum]